MYVIQKTDVADVLKKYNIFEEVMDLDLKKYYTAQDFVCMVIKVICVNNEYIIKIMTENEMELLDGNKQSDFAENLREIGLPIPHKYKNCYGKYILKYKLNDNNFLVQVEEYFGEDVEMVDSAVVYFLGDFLGKMHVDSMKNEYSLRCGSTYRAVVSNKVKFDKICKNNFLNCLDNLLVKQTIQEHNYYYKDIQTIWRKLPRAAVHADLGLTSNIVHNKLGFGVIDFNLAGDECVLGDLLITWYSSRYSKLIAGAMSVVKIEKLRRIFFDAYLKNRELRQIEDINITKIACFLNGIYYAKFLNQLFEDGYEIEAMYYAKYMADNYHKLDFGLDMRI